jgi:Protein of unknown function (DUF1553)/Protein of unknown function (DUF1549)/Planctomycete cytochrome C
LSENIGSWEITMRIPAAEREGRWRRLAGAWGLVLSFLGTRPPASLAAGVDFRRDIQPLLAKRCLSCHGPSKQKSGLRLDRKEAAFHGGDSGEPGIVPGKSTHSRLFRLVSARDGGRMPPQGKPLSPAQIDLIKRWIDSGADWPESAATSSNSPRRELAVSQEDRDFWSFRPLRRVTPPAVQDEAWIRNPIDRFIRRAQEAKGLAPAPAADARTLLRRIYFDLVGLPPDLKRVVGGRYRERRLGIELELSSSALDPAAYETLVQRLLASPQYGERWARHWLDIARYADSDGQEGDADRPNAYRFRDFVIRALNDDLPYDVFVRWQIAGDEIAPDNPQAIAATGFLVAGNSTTLNVAMEEEKLRNRANELDDMISTTGQALLGLSVACARCHDHKYDPIPTRDYYRLMRVFNSGDRTDVPLASPADVKAHRASVAQWQSRLQKASKQRDEWMKEVKGPLTKRLRAEKIAKLSLSDGEKKLLRDKPDDPKAKALANRYKKELSLSDSDYVAALSLDQKKTWDERNRAVKAIEARKPAALALAFAFADFGPEPRETWFFERGNFLARNEKMELGFLSVLTRDKSPADYWRAARGSRLRDDSTQQRHALAGWITDLNQGAGYLLARVMANRVWQHHFGEGLVRTVSDFGTRGEPPTHPDLLDWLAGELVRSGWRLKHLHRLIVTSATYRQGTAANKQNAAIDPENRLLWHRRPLRLEAEALRDSMLAVAGSLNPSMFGPAFKPPIPDEAMQARNVTNPYPRNVKDAPENRRRTIYSFHKRVVQYPLSQAFDSPDAQVSCGRRVNTTVAPQALALLNDPFIRLRARELAGRLRAEAGGAPSAQVVRAFQLGLGREPDPDERKPALAFLADQANSRRRHDPKLSAENARDLALVDFCQMLFSLNEFLYID